jgi:hypothetical protein
MGFFRGQDRIGQLSHNSGIITLALPSLSTVNRLTIRGQQYDFGVLTRTITTDVSLAANTLYFVYAFLNAGAVELRISASVPSVYRSSNPVSQPIGAFYTENSTAFYSFLSINLPDTRPSYIKTVAASTSISSLGGTYSTMNMASAINDTRNMMGSNLITIQDAGSYKLTVNIQNLPAVGSGALAVSYSINGVDQEELLRHLFTAGSTETYSTQMTTQRLSIGDVFRLRAWQNSGSTQAGMFFQTILEKTPTPLVTLLRDL